MKDNVFHNFTRHRRKSRLRAVSLFSVVHRAKRETRKWPRALLMARDGQFECDRIIILNHKSETKQSSNKSRPSINRLPRIIAPLDRNVYNNRLPRIIANPHPSRHLLFLLSPPCQVAVEPDPAKLISDNLARVPRMLALKIDQITKFGTLKKPMFCLFDVINCRFNGIIK